MADNIIVVTKSNPTVTVYPANLYPPGPNTVGTSQIQDNSVTNAKIQGVDSSKVTYSGGTTVEAELDSIDLTLTNLAGNGTGKGAHLVGYDADETVQDRLDNLAASTAGKGAYIVGYSGSTVGDKLDAFAGDSGAASIGFKSSLTGAIKVTLEAALDGSEIHSSWFGPDATGASAASTELQAAITAAAGRTLVIDPGTYKITTALKVKSNTRIVMYRATLIRGAAIDNLMRNDADGTTGVYGANSNIHIFGGTFDGATATYPGTNATLLAFGHCTGVLVRDTTFQNTTGWHFIEFNASTRCVVDNCNFSGGAEQALTTMEAVQIDAAISSAEFPWFGPYDNTVCNGVFVRNSIFSSCGSGVGTHTDPASQHTHIVISNNWFKDTYYAAVRGQAWSGVTVACNHIDGGYNGVFASPAAAFSVSNWVVGNNIVENIGNGYSGASVGRPIGMASVSGKTVSYVTITGNTVRNCTGTPANHGIYLNAATKFAVTGNIVDSVNSNGIYIDGCSYGTVCDNESALAGTTELVVTGSNTEVVIKGNRVARANIGGNTKVLYAHNIVGTSQTLGTNTSSITTPNLVNGVST